MGSGKRCREGRVIGKADAQPGLVVGPQVGQRIVLPVGGIACQCYGISLPNCLIGSGLGSRRSVVGDSDDDLISYRHIDSIIDGKREVNGGAGVDLGSGKRCREGRVIGKADAQPRLVVGPQVGQRIVLPVGGVACQCYGISLFDCLVGSGVYSRRGVVGRRIEFPLEDPGAGLLDCKDIVAGNLELYLHGELFAGFDTVQALELAMYHGEVRAQLFHLLIAQEERPWGHVVGGGKNRVCGNRHSLYRIAAGRLGVDGDAKDVFDTRLAQIDLLRHRERIGIGDQILADLGIDVVCVVVAGQRIKTDSYAVGKFVRVVGMNQHPHRCHRVVDAVEVAFGKGAEIPQACVHLLERLVDAVL